MTVDELQIEVDEWIKTIGVRYFSELTNMAILTEEVGEVARIMSRLYGDQSSKIPISNEELKENLADELSDVIWVVICLANQTGINLTESLIRNIEKKRNRDINRHKQNKKLY